jgi:DNA-binding transcriptional ArsR family regulator
MSQEKKKEETNWTFLTNHAHVLLCLAKSSSMRIRDIALVVGITERAVQRILAELTESGYIDKIKEGRRNIYKLHLEMPLKHPIESHRKISDLIELIYNNR